MEIGYIVSSLLSGLAATILAWVVFVRYVLPERNRREMARMLLNTQEVHKIMSEVVRKTNAGRFMILKTENGGGMPHPGSRLYASVIREEVLPPFEPVMEEYQRLRVDGRYVDMLAEVFRHEQQIIETRKMEGGMLQRLYVKEGVRWSYIFFLHATKNAFYYGSIATDSADGIISNDDIVTIELAVNKLRNIYKKIK